MCPSQLPRIRLPRGSAPGGRAPGQGIESQALEPRLILLERVVLDDALVDRRLRPQEPLHLRRRQPVRPAVAAPVLLLATACLTHGPLGYVLRLEVVPPAGRRVVYRDVPELGRPGRDVAQALGLSSFGGFGSGWFWRFQFLEAVEGLLKAPQLNQGQTAASLRAVPIDKGPGRPVSRILLYPVIHLRGIPGPLWEGLRLPARHPLRVAGTIWLARTGRLPGRSLAGCRRWALTPPFHPSPVPRGSPAAIGWSALCCT